MLTRSKRRPTSAGSSCLRTLSTSGSSGMRAYGVTIG